MPPQRLFSLPAGRFLRALPVALLPVALAMAAPVNPLPDHTEFEAHVVVPYAGSGARSFDIQWQYPGAKTASLAIWKLELLSDSGQVLRQWRGTQALSQIAGRKTVAWDGRDGRGQTLPRGHYQVRLKTGVVSEAQWAVQSAGTAAISRFDQVLAKADDLHEHVWPMAVGAVSKVATPSFQAMPTGRQGASAPSGRMSALMAPATGNLPYTVYYGNLHSQTNDSDGGGAIGSCTSSQSPQTGAYGPSAAFAYAKQGGLDFLLTSEHNHMYDASSGTNASASRSTALARYQSGLQAAQQYSASQPGFLALYGMEWGVISNGGHLNILGSNELWGWESNGQNELLADRLTAKNDYAALYTTMKAQGAVGQFNHPDTSGQFIVNGQALGYTADGEEVMVLSEVMNTSAFSSNTTETETSMSRFEAAFNILLERGFRVAPSTNQDNHCANWGLSSTNRTAVLLPSGAAYNAANFLSALKARRVFATMDKNSQAVLQANGHLMGERFANTGALSMSVLFANSAGRSVSKVEVFEGVPGRNGTVTLLGTSAQQTVTPATGRHFYYARVTQDDGKQLWTAPVWVDQQAGQADTTPPQVALGSSTSGSLVTFTATASDNVGVARVEFWLDGVQYSSLTAAPYSQGVDTGTLTAGSHSMVAKAFDAAGNQASSSAVSFTVAAPADTQAPVASGTVSGTSGTVTLSATATDNVGVTKVEFWVDGALSGSATASPWQWALDSTKLTNGSHSLVVKAFDAAGNVGTSGAVGFTVSNTTTVFMSEKESNGTVASANGVSAGITKITGTMGSRTDKDFFAVPLKAGQTLSVSMTGPNDYDLYLVNASGTQLAASENSNSTESVSYKAASATTVYIKVISYSGSSTTQVYTLTLSVK